MSKHAILSPSHAATWIGCPGSVTLCKDIHRTTSEYAEEGKVAHALAAAFLLHTQPKTAPDIVTLDYVNVYVNAIRRAAEGKILLVEQSVNVGNYTTEKGAKGTADAIIFDMDSGVLEVHDLKFGQGHIVMAENNEQLMLYALGAMDTVEMLYGKVNSIILAIHQPRRDHLSQWELTRNQLLEFGYRAQKAGTLALAALAGMSEVVLQPSAAACLWCSGKAICPALRDQVHKAVLDDFSECANQAQHDEQSCLTKHENVPSADFLDMAAQWISATREYINERLKNRLPTAGWKLVQGKRGNRKWIDEKATVKFLKEIGFKKSQTHETSLLSLTKIEKLVPADKWEMLKFNIVQPDGAPIAVADTDARPEYAVAKTEDFDVFV